MNDLNVFLLYYLIGGILTVLFIVLYPLLYIKLFKRALFILKTVSFKLNIEKDPYSSTFSPLEKKEKLKSNQNEYSNTFDNNIQEEQDKPLDKPVQSAIKMLSILLGWTLIVMIFFLAEFLRIFYLSPSDLEDL